jgi:mannose-6-phosphate isomerase-like protein (cupin superfamily)
MKIRFGRGRILIATAGMAVLLGCCEAFAQSAPAPDTMRSTADLLAEVERHPLAPGEEIRITTVLETADLSGLLVQVNGALPPHFHRKTQEIVHLLRGQGLFQLGEEKISIQSGAVMRVPAGVVHTFTSEGGTAVFFVVTTPRWDIKDRFLAPPPQP